MHIDDFNLNINNFYFLHLPFFRISNYLKEPPPTAPEYNNIKYYKQLLVIRAVGIKIKNDSSHCNSS